jgi:peptidoglycan/LPS O-acetylase OafA/YrhL
LDGLRGLAALAVLFNHVGVEKIGNVTTPKWLLWPADGAAAVMVFFVLSGFVIGLTNSRTAEPKQVRRYLWRRVVRLFPITFLGVLLALAVTPGTGIWTTLANIFLLANYTPYVGFLVPVMPGNENLWSLNYEAVFYLLFVPLWLFVRSLRQVFWVCLGVTVLGWYTDYVPLFVACYAAGFVFWLGGTALAWHAERTETEQTNWPSCVLLLLVTWKLRVLLNLLVFLPIPMFDGPVVRLYYFDVFPVCLWLVAIVARRELPHLKWIKLFCVLMPLVGLIIKWYRPGYFTSLDYGLAWGAYLLALALWHWRPSLQAFRFFAPIGLIAFGLYALSRPIQAFVFSYRDLFPQSYIGFVTCAALTTGLCFFVAWLAELKLQPIVNRICLKRGPARMRDNEAIAGSNR